MGRPPLNLYSTTVQITRETRDRIIALVGNNRMGAFVREAIANELSRREKPPEPDDK